MRSVVSRAAAAVAAIALLGLALSGSPAAAQTTDPLVSLDRTGTAAGETMLVRGERWPDGATLIVELCGHGGLRGSVDCDVGHQATAGVGPSGQFAVELPVGLPPAPCPCVVKATDQSTQISASAPIAVAGIPTVPITAEDLPEPRSLEIRSVRIAGGQRIAELFGAGGRRTLEFTVVNTGPLAVDSPRVSIAWGRGENPDGFVTPPTTPRLEPGQTETFTVALVRSAMTLGSQTAVVEVEGLGAPVTASAKTSAYPWGLLAIALVLLQLVLLRIRNRVRRRIAPNEDTAPAELPVAVLELTAAMPALAEASVVATGESNPRVIDLSIVHAVDEPAAVWPNAGLNGSASTTGDVTISHPASSGSSLLDDVIVARAELADLRQRALVALDRTRELSEGCTQATEGRVRDIEAQARAALRAAEASHTASIQALTAARARADALLDEATTTATAMLRDAAADRDAARAALEDLRLERDQLLDAATEAVEEVLREIDDRAQDLADDLAQRAEAPEEIDLVDRPIRVQRVDDLDGRLAEAISRAFASVRSDDANAD